MDALGLHQGAQAFSSWSEQGLTGKINMKFEE